MSFSARKIVLGSWKSEKAYDFAEISSVEVVKNGSTIRKMNRGSQLVGTAIGGLAFGGIGAIIGGLSGSSRSEELLQSVSLRVTVNDPGKPVHTICFYSDREGTRLEGIVAKSVFQQIERFHGHIVNAIQQSQNKVAAPTNSVADEIQKLWDLKQAGILADDEFATQKGRILNRSK